MLLNGLWGHASIVWKSGWRSNSFRLLAVLCAAMLFIAFLGASFSLRQPLVVAMDVGVTGLRFSLLLLALFWVHDLFSQDLTNRTALLMLAYPVSRANYLLGRFLGIAVLLALALLACSLLLLLTVKLSAWGYADSSAPLYGVSYWLMMLGIYIDILSVVAFALCVSTFSETPFLPLCVSFFFALVARSYATVLSYLKLSGMADEQIQKHFTPVLDAFSWLIPNLGALDWRDAVLYQTPLQALTMTKMSAAVLMFTALMLVLAIAQFKRRQLQ